ncbi:MAG: hypothetical protein HC799_18715 [Limnothrix sp. RL_2_0]|nr:hypothetical protein [Limnothrix sp. RL_2_0]
MMTLKLSFPKHFWLSLCFFTIVFFLIEISLYGLVDSLKEGTPELFGIYALRSLFFIIISAVLILLIHLHAVQKQQQNQLIGWIDQRWSKSQKKTALGTLFFVLLSIVFLVLDPALFSYLAHEDIFIEPLSAFLFLAGAAIFLRQVGNVPRSNSPQKKWLITGLYILAGIFFVIAMEEVSWLQRVVEFETPDAFALNKQGEFNIHNFATGMFEYAFYSGAFVCLVVLPFLHLTSVIPKYLQGLEIFIGDSFTLCLSSIFIAYNYDLWNAFPTQIPYFMTLFMLVSLVFLSRQRQMQNIFIAFFIMLLMTQISFLTVGHNMPRLWDATEYKEGFIAFGFFLYALNVRRNLLQGIDYQSVKATTASTKA